MAKQSLKEKLKKKREELKKKQSGNVYFPKEGTTRFRVLPTGEECDWAIEVKYFYLGNEIKGVYSPATFDKPCPIMEYYEELKEQGESANAELKKAMVPRTKYLIPVLIYEDEKGTKIDEGNSGRLLQVPNRIYAQMIDIFLDSDFPEFNDVNEGFDFKLKREGQKLTNTTYTINNMPPKPIDGRFNKPADPEEMAKGIIEDYDTLEDKLANFLADFGADPQEKEEKESSDSKPKPRKRKRPGGDE